jgi:hypothetical protein
VIHLHRLRLASARRHYEVDFDRRDSNLAIIAGPIHTGKTTILQMVDYLLGNSDHPTHPELARTVRTAALELTIGERRFTIERPLFSSQQVAFVRPGGLDDAGPVTPKTIDPPGADTALSAWLLDAVGLGGARLKVTEGNPNTPVHDLSFRDVMPLAMLPSRRLDNQALLFEGQDQRHYKLRQVIELIFDVHDDRLSQLLDLQKRLRDERRAADQEVANLRTFLAEEQVPAVDVVRAQLEAARERVDELGAAIATIEQQAAATTSYADQLRRRYADARDASGLMAARLRDRQSLLERLMPLRAQYAEDERKLVFFDEAKRLIDPLSIERCPVCLERLPQAPTIAHGSCTLCGQEPAPVQETAFAFDRERRSLRARIRDLDAYTEQVEQQVADASAELLRLQADEARLAADLDARTARDLSPFVAQRDHLSRESGERLAAVRELERAVRWHEAVERREANVAQLMARLAAVADELEELRSDQPDRDAVVRRLSERFAALLTAWGFPKLDDPEPPFIDARFVPHVRGRPYRDIGSDGALTLIALAWTLSIYELAIETRAPHPGFLLIDSPQKNLAPNTGQAVDEFMDPMIVQRLYDHLELWAAEHPDAQLVLVDHEPPSSVREHEIVRFTRRADPPPYGLIDDQIDAAPPATSS